MMRIGQDTESTPKKASAADVSGLVDLLRGKTKQMRQPGAKPRADNADEELKDAGTIKMFKVAPEPADQTPKGFGSQIEEHARRYFERPGRKLKRFLDSVEKEIEKSRRVRENVQALDKTPVPDMQPGLPDRSFGGLLGPGGRAGFPRRGIGLGQDHGDSLFGGRGRPGKIDYRNLRELPRGKSSIERSIDAIGKKADKLRTIKGVKMDGDVNVGAGKFEVKGTKDLDISGWTQEQIRKLEELFGKDRDEIPR